MNLTEEQWRRGGHAARFNDSDYVFLGEDVERIVAEHVETARAEDQREIAMLRGEKAAEEMHAEGKSCPVCTHLQVVDLVAQLDCAQAAERALVERIEAVLPDFRQVAALLARYAQDECECDHFTTIRARQLVAAIDRLRAALAAVRPDTEGAEG